MDVISAEVLPDGSRKITRRDGTVEVIPFGGKPSFKDSFAASQSPSADVRNTVLAGGPGAADIGPMVAPFMPSFDMSKGYPLMNPAVKPTTPLKTDPGSDTRFEGWAKNVGNTVWNLPGTVANLPSTAFNAVSTPWGITKAVTKPLESTINATVDAFTKPINVAEADRLVPTVPKALPGTPMDPTVPAGVDQRWVRGSQLTGGVISPAYFARTWGKEGGYNKDGSYNLTAQNPNSTARGPGQFIDSTWLMVLRQGAGQFGLPPAVVAQIPADGKMPKGALRDQLLALKTDPNASLIATAVLARANYDELSRPVTQGGLGRKPSEEEVYLAHLTGPTAAARILTAPPGAPVTAYVSADAVKANPGMFVSQGRPRTVGEFVGRQATQWQGAALPGAGAGAPPSTSFTLPAPPMMAPVQQTPMPVIAPPPTRGTPMMVDTAGVQARVDAAAPREVLSPEMIAARKRDLVLSNILQGLAKGFIPGAVAGYGKGREAGSAYEQSLLLSGEDQRQDWNRWAISPEEWKARTNADNSNAISEADFLDRTDAWKNENINADRVWEVTNNNAGAVTQTGNSNETNRWKWRTEVATSGGIQNLGNGTVMVTEANPETGTVTQRVVPVESYLGTQQRQGAALGAFSGASVPAEIKNRLGALQVAASQGPDAMFLEVAKEIAASPLADTILSAGNGAEIMRREAETESRGDKRRAEGIFIAKIAKALALLAQSDPEGLRQSLREADRAGIVTAGGVLGYTGQ